MYLFICTNKTVILPANPPRVMSLITRHAKEDVLEDRQLPFSLAESTPIAPFLASKRAMNNTATKKKNIHNTCNCRFTC